MGRFRISVIWNPRGSVSLSIFKCKVALSLWPGLFTITNCLGVQLPNTLYPPSHPHPAPALMWAAGLLVQPTGTPAEVQSCLQAHPVKKSRHFQPTWLSQRVHYKVWKALAWHRRDIGHVVGDMEEGRVAALIWTMDQRLQLRLSATALEAKQQAEGHACWKKTPILTDTISSGWASEQVIPQMPQHWSGKETSDSLIAGSLCQAIAWRTTALGPGSW